MSDHAPATCSIYVVPKDNDKLRQVFNELEEYGFLPSKYGAFTLGEEMYDTECRLDVVEALTPILHELGCVAVVAQEARYEFDGSIGFANPNLGEPWTGTGSQEGCVLVWDHQIDVALIESKSFHEAYAAYLKLQSLLRELTGAAYRGWLTEFRKVWSQDGVIVERPEEDEDGPVCLWCSERIHRIDTAVVKGNNEIAGHVIVWVHTEGNATSCAQNQLNCGREPIEAAGTHVAEVG